MRLGCRLASCVASTASAMPRSTSMDCSPVARRLKTWSPWSIANIYPASPDDGAPKWGIRSHPPRQVVGLEGHYKSQGLGVPVRPVSPFSDPSSNLAQPSRSGAVRLATGQHSPDYPCVLVGDRDCRAVITAPLAKLIDPHTSR